ncbi:MAG: plasmid stabilization protein [Methylobacterium sp.]
MDDLTFEVDDDLLDVLRVRATVNGRTLEDEARHLILRSLDNDRRVQSGETAATAFANLRAKAGGGGDLNLPTRVHEPMRPIDLDA